MVKILGVSGAFGHDAAAALVVDGCIIAACEEERFTRQKRAPGQAAVHSVQACLTMGNLRMRDIDFIAISWDPGKAPHDLRLRFSLEQFLDSQRLAHDYVPPLIMVGHHIAHAALAYFTSGFDHATVVVMDGQGEDASTTLYAGSGTSLREIAQFPIADSLGFFYNTVTRYIGFGPGAAGKTMGLSALGCVQYDFPEILLSDDGYTVTVPGASKKERVGAWFDIFEREFGPAGQRVFRSKRTTGRLAIDVDLPSHLRDAAASAQAALERTVCHVVKSGQRLSGYQNVVLSGGVGLNCSANGRLRGAVDGDLYVNGAANDGGTALGAALAVAAQSDVLTPHRLRTLLLGPCYDPDPVVELAQRLGLRVNTRENKFVGEVANLLELGQVGGWFNGRSEYGPRALGGRSIIARSDSVTIRDRVNAIKGREPWRPLAPAIRESSADAFKLSSVGADFMVEAQWLPASMDIAGIEGAVHVDSSLRPLIVSDPEHPFYELLHEVGRRVGTSSIINTSLNSEDEAIVNSPFDALHLFSTSDLDFLAIDGRLIRKG